MTNLVKRNFKTVTKAGEDRKFNRIITHLLKDTDPTLYKKLAKAARAQIKKDNVSLDVPIMTKGLDVVHKTSEELSIKMSILQAKRNKRDIDKIQKQLTRSVKDEKSKSASNNNRRN